MSRQAAIGPGMAIYTRYGRVLDANGEPMKVREALAMINQILDESLQYNSLVGSWPEIRQLASSEAPAEQTELL